MRKTERIYDSEKMLQRKRAVEKMVDWVRLEKHSQWTTQTKAQISRKRKICEWTKFVQKMK